MKSHRSKSTSQYQEIINSYLSAFVNAHRRYPVRPGHLWTMYVDLNQAEAYPGDVAIASLPERQRNQLQIRTQQGGYGLWIVVQRGQEVLYKTLAFLTKVSGNESRSDIISVRDTKNSSFLTSPQIFDF